MLSVSVAILTAAEFSKITGCPDLSKVNAGNLTLAGVLDEATNALIRLARSKGVDPAKVTNTDELKALAAYWAAGTVYQAMPRGGASKNEDLAAAFFARWEAEAKDATFVTTEASVKTAAPRGLPIVFNQDSAPLFGPRDHRRPGRPTRGPYRSR